MGNTIKLRGNADLKRMTNTEFVVHVMEHGSPLRQAFIIEAISKYAKAVAASTPEKLDTPFVSGAAWHKVAQEIHALCEAQYPSAVKSEG